MTDYRAILKSKAEKSLSDFNKKLMPDTAYPILGVKVPAVREIAKIAIKNGDYVAPENYNNFEECLLDGFIIVLSKAGFDEKVKRLDKFLDFADSWGLTDSVAAAFKDIKKSKNAENFIYDLLNSGKKYKIRFAIVLLTFHFCGNYFKDDHLKAVLSVKTGEYYTDMAIAWYLSVLLVKNRDAGLNVIKSFTLPKSVQNKAIQKAVESFRISDADKNYLKTLKIK